MYGICWAKSVVSRIKLINWSLNCSSTIYVAELAMYVVFTHVLCMCCNQFMIAIVAMV